MMKSCCWIVRVLLLIAAVGQASTKADKKGTYPLISPIDNFRESLVASAAHGTTLALQTTIVRRPVRDGEDPEEQHDTDDDGSKQDAIILILHHGSVAEKEDGLVEEGNTRLVGNLKVKADESSVLAAGLPADRLSILNRNTIVGMTGLASDVDYVTRVLRKKVEQYRSIHDGATAALTRSLSTFQLVQLCSQLLQDSCRIQGARPFGVQSLFIGKKASPSSSLGGDGLDIFTVDTGGSSRHWQRGAAIGRKSFAICQRLSDYDATTTIGPLETLRVGIQACAEEFSSDGSSSSSSKNGRRFSAFLLQWDNGTNTISVDQVCPVQVKDCLAGK
jgi:20S proteasome alpha/beta subunit